MKNIIRTSFSIVTLVSGVFLLSACGEQTTNEISQQIQEGNYTQAIEALTKRLEEDPSSSSLHALLIQARLGDCVTQNCFNGKTDVLLNTLKISLPLLPNNDIDLGDGIKLNPNLMMHDYVEKISQLPDQPQPLITMVKALKGHPSQQVYTAALFDYATYSVTTLDEMTIRKNLQNISAAQILPDAQQHYLNVLIGLATNNKPLLRNNTIALRSRQDVNQLPPQVFRALIPAAYLNHMLIHEDKATLTFAETFPTMLENLQWPTLLSVAAKKEMAKMLEKLLQDPVFTEEFQNRMGDLTPKKEANEPQIKAVSTPEMAETDTLTEEENEETGKTAQQYSLPNNSLAKLYLQRLSLTLNPNQPSVWENFMKHAKTKALENGDLSLLSHDIPIGSIPPNVRVEYNNTLFAVIDELNKRQESIYPLLNRLYVGEETPKTLTRRKEVVSTALNNALATKDIKAVLAYAQLLPSIAKERRQAIVPVIITELRNTFGKDDFEQFKALSTFLANNLEIDFDLDNLLMQEFTVHLKDIQIADQFNTDTPEYLLKDQEKVALNLGPKFEFLKQHFLNKPDIIDGILKNLVLGAKGQYGTPTALYRLFHLFDEKQFSAQERETYLVSTIRNSITRDDKITATDIAKYGYDLYQRHNSLGLNLIASEVLNRIDGIKEGRVIWNTTPEDLKETFSAIQPEFAALMKGIDAFDKREFTTAASSFAQLRSKYFLEQAAPYIEHYTTALDTYRGLYLSNNLTDKELPIVGILITPQASKLNAGKELQNINITFITTVGAAGITNQQTLSTSFAKTWRKDITAELDFNALTLAPNYTANPLLDLPYEIAEKLKSITLLKRKDIGDDAQLNIELEDGKTITFTRTSKQPADPLLPDGRFMIQQRLSESNDTTNGILPAGTILELLADMENPIQPQKGDRNLDIIYPVAGTLQHPANPGQKYPLKGFYNPTKHTTNLSVTYPLGEDGQAAEASMRCNIANSQILCGLHNTHNTRQRYHHIVAGAQTLESKRKADERLESLRQMLKEKVVPTLQVTPETPDMDNLEESDDKEHNQLLPAPEQAEPKPQPAAE